ncbi:carbonic anhydrase [Sphingomonas mollis]|uniref:carbonic anhydrase n=1 Tax=Sphingomonas mollis TaxID=2795726 RepID=A0ABS0XSX3_9SPHN|nr:carbonic anhydrase [Sphingomonas sp. BT553]MBJ6123141.1 carbonic anhydrase [Sphingomonas sp. BT553]
MKQSKQLLLANRAWAVELTDENADFFSRSVAGQKPEFMWIGCSGSRVSPEQKTQSLPGRMVIHSNIANLVNPEDLNLMSTLQHAVDVLAVPNIIVCGHHGCGGIKATLSGSATGPVKRWLEPAHAALCDHADEVHALPEGEAQVNRLVEVNVRDQLVNLARTDTVQAAFARGQDLTLHGWVYDIRDGLLKPLMEIDRHTALDQVGRPEPVLTV